MLSPKSRYGETKMPANRKQRQFLSPEVHSPPPCYCFCCSFQGYFYINVVVFCCKIVIKKDTAEHKAETGAVTKNSFLSAFFGFEKSQLRLRLSNVIIIIIIIVIINEFAMI